MTSPSVPFDAPAPPPAVAPRPRPVPIPRDAIEGGLAFHRLVFARRRAGWWTPLVVGLLGVAFYAVMLGAVLIGLILVALFTPGVADGLLQLDAAAPFDLTDPLILVVLLGTIALMLPAYLLASLIVNGQRVGLISSAARRIRWGWLFVCLGIAAAVFIALTGLSLLLPGEPVGADGGIVAPADNPHLWTTLIVLLLIVPFQAAAEEYVFRGYLQQAIGRWLRHPLFAILLPVPLFVLGHFYDPLGQAGVAVFAVAAGWLTWRTGGLEAAIALHIVNNLAAFLLGLGGLSDVNATSPGVLSFVSSVVLIGGYVGIVEVAFRRSGLGRTLVFVWPAAPPRVATGAA